MEKMSVLEEEVRKKQKEEDLYKPLMGGINPHCLRTSAISTCYSCRYFSPGLPTACSHPCSYRVQWDMIRQSCYRVPSQVMTNEHRGVCPYFLADSIRSVQFLIEEEEMRGLLEMIAIEAAKKDIGLHLILRHLETGIYDQLMASFHPIPEEEEEEEWDPSLLSRLIEKLRSWGRVGPLAEEYEEEEYEEEEYEEE